MDVEAQGVCFAFGPRHDVRGAEKGWVGDSGQRAAALPIFHQRLAENVLADALHHETLGFRGPRNGFGLRKELIQRCVGQADAEAVGPVEGVMEFVDGVERIYGSGGSFTAAVEGAAGGIPSSVATAARPTASSHGPSFEPAPSQISPCAVVERKWSQPASIPKSMRKPLSKAALWSSVLTTNEIGACGLIMAIRMLVVEITNRR